MDKETIKSAISVHKDHLQAVVQSYNDCLTNMMHIQQALSYNPVGEILNDYIPIGGESEDGSDCYDCKMQKFGLVLLKSVKDCWGKKASQIKETQCEEERNPTIELLNLKLQKKDNDIEDLRNALNRARAWLRRSLKNEEWMRYYKEENMQEDE